MTMAPLKRLHLTGPAAVFVTSAINGMRRIFDSPACAKTFLLTLRDNLEIYHVSAMAYVLMPNHFHAVLGFAEYQSMSPFIQALKSISSRRIRNVLGSEDLSYFTREGPYRLWQARYDDVILITQEQFEIKLRYIHNNPVKSGLVQYAAEWPYSSAIDWSGGRNKFVPIDREFKWLP